MTVVATSAVKVSAGYAPSLREIRKIAVILEKQGLIEPLKLDKNGEIGHLDPHDPARLAACKMLGWPTVIVALGEG